MYVITHACMYAYMYVCIHIYIYLYICVYILTYIHNNYIKYPEDDTGRSTISKDKTRVPKSPNHKWWGHTLTRRLALLMLDSSGGLITILLQGVARDAITRSKAQAQHSLAQSTGSGLEGPVI